ncbi:MAG: hypothetical protein Q9217_001797 [Psora testacea]
MVKNRIAFWNSRIEALAGLESRGIGRVLSHERHNGGIQAYVQMMFFWFSVNTSATNIITALLGPLLFRLGWKDCVCLVVFANALAACGPAYISIFGPVSGNRTMVLGRYIMGYWPSKLICLLVLLNEIGWGIIGCIITGQMISAVNGHISIAVGCVLSALCIGAIATFGIRLLHAVERCDPPRAR